MLIDMFWVRLGLPMLGMSMAVISSRLLVAIVASGKIS